VRWGGPGGGQIAHPTQVAQALYLLTIMRKLRRSTWIVLALVTLIVIAHVFLWLSDMPTGQKLMWTALNTVAWTIILAPVFLVDRWLDALRQRNSGDRLE
jgi:hypothetical protein